MLQNLYPKFIAKYQEFVNRLIPFSFTCFVATGHSTVRNLQNDA